MSTFTEVSVVAARPLQTAAAVLAGALPPGETVDSSLLLGVTVLALAAAAVVLDGVLTESSLPWDAIDSLLLLSSNAVAAVAAAAVDAHR